MSWERHKGFPETGLELVLKRETEKGKAFKAGGTASAKTGGEINKARQRMANAGQKGLALQGSRNESRFVSLSLFPGGFSSLRVL